MRDRVQGFKRVKASQLRPHPLNWRQHPDEQRSALATVIEQIGFTGAIVAREVDDGLEILDGHLRHDMAGDYELPVLVVDLNDEEAATMLATFDPLGAMAKADKDNLAQIIQMAAADSKEMETLLNAVAWEHQTTLPKVGTGELGGDLSDTLANCVCAECGNEHVRSN